MSEVQGLAAVSLPLQGKRIAVTRAREQSATLVEQLRALGALPVECPAIRIAPLSDFARLDAAIDNLASYDWVVFTSVNGVQAVASRMIELGRDISLLAARKLAAIGPATAAQLKERGLAPTFMPDSYVAEAIIEQIGDVDGCRVLLPRADIARHALAEGLRERGAQVDEVAAYRTVQDGGGRALLGILRSGSIDAVTFTSSSTVRYTISSLAEAGAGEQEAVDLLKSAAVVCIGPITAATATECGLRVTAVAEEYTTKGLVKTLVQLFAHPPGGSKC